MPRVLLFDLDGTLTDPRRGIVTSLRHGLATVGAPVPPDRELEQYIGPPLRETFSLLMGGDLARAGRALEAFRERYGSVGLFENEVYAGIPEVLARLSTVTAAMYVATSKPQAYAVRIVEHFGLASFFRAVYGCEMDGRRADKTELLAFLLRQEGIDPRTAVMIGDRRHDVIAAIANGIGTVGAAWGFGTSDELRDAGADVLCPAPEALPSVLGW